MNKATLLLVLLLTGCTQFDKKDSKEREWQIILESPECYMQVDVTADDIVTDDTIDIRKPGQ